MSQLPPEFDEYQSLSEYDPQYTADISINMHVPDHIDVTGSEDSTLAGVQLLDDHDDHIAPHMTVPDKIIVLGQDRSVGVQRNDPKLHLDLIPLPNETSFVNLSTPPRVLTLDDKPFPGFYDDSRHVTTANNADGPMVNSHRLSSVPAPADVLAVHRHLLTLSEHVKRLEIENSRRWRREMLLYPLLFGYVIVRLARWFVSAK